MYIALTMSTMRKLYIRDNESFFLWGPRQSGKTTYLKTRFPDAFRIDLLNSEQYRKYVSNPEILREELRSLDRKKLVIIDEVQRVPALLDEVHWAIENLDTCFGLCGSSARKVRKGHANLLGGRAYRYELFGFIAAELGKSFDLTRMLNNGYLPRGYLAKEPLRVLRPYVADYLKEEIANEALTRNLPAFSDFLRVASVTDTEIVDFTKVASECAVSRTAVKNYYDILVDTLLGRFLPAFTKRAKRRVIQSAKFYLADVGVVNFLAGRGTLTPRSELFGKAFENWVHHELIAYLCYTEKDVDLHYWRTSSGHEVDFIIGDMEVALEAKSSSRIDNQHLRGLRSIVKDFDCIRKRLVVSMVNQTRETEDGIVICSPHEFVRMLWEHELI